MIGVGSSSSVAIIKAICLHNHKHWVGFRPILRQNQSLFSFAFLKPMLQITHPLFFIISYKQWFFCPINPTVHTTMWLLFLKLLIFWLFIANKCLHSRKLSLAPLMFCAFPNSKRFLSNKIYVIHQIGFFVKLG